MKSQLNVLVQYLFRALHETKYGSIYNKNIKNPVIAAYDFASALALSKSEYPCGAQAAMTGLLVFRLVINLQS